MSRQTMIHVGHFCNLISVASWGVKVLKYNFKWFWTRPRLGVENLSTLGHRITFLPNVSVSGPRQNFGEHFPCLDQGFALLLPHFSICGWGQHLQGQTMADHGWLWSLRPSSCQVRSLFFLWTGQIRCLLFFSLWTRSKVFVINSGVQGLGT